MTPTNLNENPPFVALPRFECNHCGHSWMPRTVAPVQCPRCTSRTWNKRKSDTQQMPTTENMEAKQ